MWQPITDLPDNWRDMAEVSLEVLAQVWDDQRQRLKDTQTYQTFLEKLQRKIAIETGIIERLYTLDRGITYALIEYGINDALISHEVSDKMPQRTLALIRDQKQEIEYIFD